jgi:hypothetical protein
MSDLTGLSQAMAAEFGLTAQLWGYVIGLAVMGTFMLVMVWAIGNKNSDNTMLIIVSAFIGLGVNTAIGWFDVWLFLGIFILVVLSWVWMGMRGTPGGA